MTVLQRNEGRQLSTVGAKGYLVGLALAVVGLGAAFGLSRLIGTDTEFTGAMVDRSVAMEQNHEALIEGGAAHAAVLGSIPASTFNEAAIPSRATQPATEWALEDELAAIKGGSTAAGTTAALSNMDDFVTYGEVYGDALDTAAAERVTDSQSTNEARFGPR